MIKRVGDVSQPPVYQLTNRYLAREGRAFMSGVQALARIPIEQLRVDRAAGLHTAAFISGYQGSPLGGFDQEIARAARLVPDLDIVCRPAVNVHYQWLNRAWTCLLEARTPPLVV